MQTARVDPPGIGTDLERSPALRRSLTVLLVAAMGAAILVTFTSLWWPRFHDAPILEYVAWLIRQGRRPYTDMFDMNFPGTYLFHVAGQDLLGSSDLSFRVRDVALLGLGCFAAYRVLRVFDRPTAAAAVVFVVARYIAYGGATQSLQRDWIMAVLALVAAALLLDGSHRAWKLLAAGLVLGFVTTMKPQGVLMLLIAPLLIALHDHAVGEVEWRRIARKLLVVLTGAVVAVAGTGLWLVQTGGWHGFVWIARHYVPLYSALDSSGRPYSSLATGLIASFGHSIARPDVILLGSGGALLVSLDRTPIARGRIVALLAMMGAGFVHAVWGIKDFEYHYWPATVPALCLCAIAFGDLWNGRTRGAVAGRMGRWASLLAKAFLAVFVIEGALIGATGAERVLHHPNSFGSVPARVWILVMAAPLVLVALHSLGIRMRSAITWAALAGPLALITGLCLTVAIDPGGTTAIGVRPAYDTTEITRTDWIADILRSRLRPGDRVQALDTTGGGMSAELNAHAIPANRFLYDFYFFHNRTDPVILRMRHELIAAWRARPPRFVLQYRSSWGDRDSYESFRLFPQLAHELTLYRVIAHDGEVRVLERTAGRE